MHDLVQKTRIGFEYASEFVRCEMEYTKIRHTFAW